MRVSLNPINNSVLFFKNNNSQKTDFANKNGKELLSCLYRNDGTLDWMTKYKDGEKSKMLMFADDGKTIIDELKCDKKTPKISFTGNLLEVKNASELLARLNANCKIMGKDYLHDFDRDSNVKALNHIVLLDKGIPTVFYSFDCEDNCKIRSKEIFKYDIKSDILDEEEMISESFYPEITDFESAIAYAMGNALSYKTINLLPEGNCSVRVVDNLNKKIMSLQEFSCEGKKILEVSH